MLNPLYKGIQEIRKEQKPILKAWELSFAYLKMPNSYKKLIEIISNHENIFINKNSYHNQYHFAEVIWVSAFLAKNEFISTYLQQHALVLLLAATFHDTEHPGRGNKEPFELEKISSHFFKQWWNNNSLFVENLIEASENDIIQVINELILFTDFQKGHSKVVQDYKNKQNYEMFNFKIVKLKQILIEADIFLISLPGFAFDRTKMLLKENNQNIEDDKIWELLLNFNKDYAKNIFVSNASQSLGIQEEIKNFVLFLEKNKNIFSEGKNLEQKVYKKLKIIY
jgi:hypothetical protein